MADLESLSDVEAEAAASFDALLAEVDQICAESVAGD